jgi:DNA-binding CsgD family transcriptional regulator
VLIGRESECARLDLLLSEARAGVSGVLVLVGEAGIGKTALCEYAIGCADGMHVLTCRGVPTETQLAFAGLTDLVSPVLDRLERIPGPQRAALEAAMALGPPVANDRFAVCAATLSLLAASAEECPVLAILDDVHWLDAPSLEAVLFAARRLDAEGIVLLLARRSASEPLDRELPELRVPGLEAAAADALVDVTTGDACPPDVVARLRAAADGNPLALLRALELLSPEQLAGEAELPAALPTPSSLEATLLRKIDPLPGPTRALLVVASASDSSDRAEILRAAQADADSVAAAVAAGVVAVTDDELVFLHPLLRSAVYDSAPEGERRAAHLALAETATGVVAGERRAWHLARAASAPDEHVATLLEGAGASARARGGHAAAADALERSAVMSTEDSDRRRRLLAASDDARRAGRAEEALRLADEALELAHEPLQRARVNHRRASLQAWRGEPVGAHRLLVEEAGVVASASPAAASLMLVDATWPALMSGELAAGRAAAESAHELATTEPARTVAALTLAQALVLVGEGKAGRAMLEQGLAGLDRATDAEPSMEGDPGAVDLDDSSWALERAALRIGQVLTWLEDYEQARRRLSLIADDARRRSLVGTLPFALASLSELSFRTGDWVAAAADASEGLRLATETGQASGLGLSLVSLARVEAARGRDAECRAHAGRAFELAGFGASLASVYAGACLGLLALGIGAVDDAIEHLERVAGAAERFGLTEPSVVQWAPDLVEAYVRVGRIDEAEHVLGAFESQAFATDGTWARATAVRCRGLLAADDRFDTAFADALDWHSRTTTPFERARTELCYGERLRRARRRADSRPILRAALETFQRLGATPWADRCRVELGASVESTRPRDDGASTKLTPQELQVAIVVATGKTNREAGAALFLSPKTIETHLGRVYRKLDIRSRTELAALLARERTDPAGFDS